MLPSPQQSWKQQQTCADLIQEARASMPEISTPPKPLSEAGCLPLPPPPCPRPPCPPSPPLLVSSLCLLIAYSLPALSCCRCCSKLRCNSRSRRRRDSSRVEKCDSQRSSEAPRLRSGDGGGGAAAVVGEGCTARACSGSADKGDPRLNSHCTNILTLPHPPTCALR